MPAIKPIVDDFGDGYTAFCPRCLVCLGWEVECPSQCPDCGQEIDLEET